MYVYTEYICCTPFAETAMSGHPLWPEASIASMHTKPAELSRELFSFFLQIEMSLCLRDCYSHWQPHMWRRLLRLWSSESNIFGKWILR